MEAEGDLYEGMLVEGDRIGDLFKDCPSSYPAGARVIDLRGRTVLPGFTDSHAHFLGSSLLYHAGCQISEISEGALRPDTVDAAIDKLAAFASSRPGRSTPVVGFNYIVPSFKEERLPSRNELDVALPDRKVVILGMDGHASAYSSPALEAIGIDPKGHPGVLVGEEHDMHIGTMTDLVISSLSLFDIILAMQKFAFHAAARGLTCIHCLEGSEDKPNNLALRLLILAARALPIRLRLFTQYRDTDDVQPFLKSLSYPRLGGCQAWEMDGSVGSLTAAFDEPFAGTEENRGRCYYSRDEILPYVEKAHRQGFQVSTHAIGPRGIETILSAFEEVLSPESGDKNPRRHRIDHFEFPRPDQVKRAISNLGLLITAQPGYAWMDERFQKAYRKYLTPAQFESQIPLKTITDLGGVICGSSDSPVQDINPFLQIQGMVDFPLQSQKLSMFEALKAYTANGAYSTFEEDVRGSLAPGKYADFVILEDDPFTLPTNRVAEARVAETWIAGRPVVQNILPPPLFLLKALFSPKTLV